MLPSDDFIDFAEVFRVNVKRHFFSVQIQMRGFPGLQHRCPTGREQRAYFIENPRFYQCLARLENVFHPAEVILVFQEQRNRGFTGRFYQ